MILKYRFIRKVINIVILRIHTYCSELNTEQCNNNNNKIGRKYNCGPLPQPINGIWTSNSTELVPNQQELFDEGFKAHFKCNFGFYPMGDSEAECLNGVWTFKTSSQKPVCIHFEPRCAYPGDPSYGRTVPRKEVYEINEMVEYECGPGNVTTLYSQGHCQSDGSWDHLPSACGIYNGNV